MLKKLINRRVLSLIVPPLLRRLGTALAVYLAAQGVPADSVDQLISAIGIIVGFASDILLSALNKQESASLVRLQTLRDLGYRQDFRV